LTKGELDDIIKRTQFLGIFPHAQISILREKLHTIGCPVSIGSAGCI